MTEDKHTGNNSGDQAAPRGAHFKGASSQHTRESLEGAVAKPVDVDEKSLADLTSTKAEGFDSSVRRPSHSRDRFERSLHDELEPTTVASGKASGTAKLRGAAASAAGSSSHDDAPTEVGARRRRVPLAVKVLIGLLVAILVAAGALWAWVSGIEGEMKVEEEDRAELEEALTAPEAQAEAFYALIIGSDAREGDYASRSDVIMLARVDTANSKISLISIPRDTMLYSGDGQVEKINAEYNYGPGPTVRAVSEFAGVDISHYVEVNFNGLVDVVDALGGVTVDIPENIVAGNGGVTFSAGEQVLDGEQALAYARERYNVSGGDFGRAQAQRQIVEAIVREVLGSNPMEMPGIVTQLAKSITTDLSVPDIISYAMDFQSGDSSLQIYSAACPSYTLSQGGVSYVATMYDEWRQMMQRVDAGLDPNDESAQIPEEQQTDERLGAATNAAGPKDYHDLAENAMTTDDVAQ